MAAEASEGLVEQHVASRAGNLQVVRLLAGRGVVRPVVLACHPSVQRVVVLGTEKLRLRLSFRDGHMTLLGWLQDRRLRADVDDRDLTFFHSKVGLQLLFFFV